MRLSLIGVPTDQLFLVGQSEITVTVLVHNLFDNYFW